MRPKFIVHSNTKHAVVHCVGTSAPVLAGLQDFARDFRAAYDVSVFGSAGARKVRDRNEGNVGSSSEIGDDQWKGVD